MESQIGSKQILDADPEAILEGELVFAFPRHDRILAGMFDITASRNDIAARTGHVPRLGCRSHPKPTNLVNFTMPISRI